MHNFGATAATFNVSSTLDAGDPHSVAFGSSQVTVPAKGESSVDVTLSVPSATGGSSVAFSDVSGLVTFTATGGANHGVTLRLRIT